jgi:4-hydroxy-tetrahydrodipicolinate synthase
MKDQQMDTRMICAGLWPPVATPFRPDLSIDFAAFLAHSRALLDDGADGLAILGTTSEANSLTLAERREVIDALLADGFDPAKLLPGTGACAIGEAVALSRHATSAGCAGVLLLPPFFYKGVPDEGLFRYVAEVIAGVGDDRLRIYLYHIPQMAGAGWSLDLIARLIAEFPETVVGLKDSSGDWQNTRAIIERFPGFAVFPASEAVLSQAMALGAAGCISASANVNADGIARLLAAIKAGEGVDEAQAAATAVRNAVTAQPLVPAVKAILAARYGASGWDTPRPPMVALPDDARKALFADPAVKALL